MANCIPITRAIDLPEGPIAEIMSALQDRPRLSGARLSEVAKWLRQAAAWTAKQDRDKALCNLDYLHPEDEAGDEDDGGDED